VLRSDLPPLFLFLFSISPHFSILLCLWDRVLLISTGLASTQSFWFCLLSTGITGVYYHDQREFPFFNNSPVDSSGILSHKRGSLSQTYIIQCAGFFSFNRKRSSAALERPGSPLKGKASYFWTQQLQMFCSSASGATAKDVAGLEAGTV
jgi:hypothetical protein